MNLAPDDAAPLAGGAGVHNSKSSQNLTPLCVPEGVPEDAWLRVAKPDDGQHWAIAERDATGEVVGTAYRHSDGSKDFRKGGRRGLILPWPLDPYAGSSDTRPVFVVEGASDTAALLGLGLDAVGVPMAGQCGDWLAELLNGRHVVIVADADNAGRTGTAKLAKALAGRAASVRVLEPPEGAKDARAAVIAYATAEDFLSLAADAEPWQSASGDAGGEPGSAVIVNMEGVKPEPVEWLWPGRFAIGKLSIIAGDPGLGKSFVSLDMAARVTRGDGWPDAIAATGEPGGVVLLSAEDDLADTIRPRLDAAGADVRRVRALQAVRMAGGRSRGFDLARDLPALREAIGALERPRLVVIDPISAYLGDADSHNNTAVRGLLAPLASLASELRVAVVLVSHLNKGGPGVAAAYRVMGSLAFAAAARAVYAVVRDESNDARRLLLPVKSNLGNDTDGCAYCLEGTPAPRVVWERDRVPMSAREALAGPGRATPALNEACEWLRDELSDGPKPAGELMTRARADGITEATLRRAKERIDAQSTREGYGNEGRWLWVMPHSPGEPPLPETCAPMAVDEHLCDPSPGEGVPFP